MDFSDDVSLSLRIQLLSKPAVQSGGVGFGGSGHLGGIKVKDAIVLHCGKCEIQCFWSSLET